MNAIGLLMLVPLVVRTTIAGNGPGITHSRAAERRHRQNLPVAIDVEQDLVAVRRLRDFFLGVPIKEQVILPARRRARPLACTLKILSPAKIQRTRFLCTSHE